MNKNFYYDPQKQGYDSAVWQTIAGVPAVAANHLVLNAATTISHADIYSGEITMNVTCPVAPVAAQSKRFGLAQLNLGAFVGFRITEDKFYYESVDPNGINTAVEIPWVAAWTAAAVTFKIVWNNHNVEFWIGTEKIAILNWSNTSFSGLNTHFPLSIYVMNANADDLKVKYIEVRNADMFFPANHISATISAGDIEIGAVELKNGADDTRAIINAANTARANTNPVVLSQIIDAAGLVNTVSANIIPPSTLLAGETIVAVSGTAVALGASLATKSIYIRAKLSNTGDVFVGDSTVDKTTSRQIVLSPDDSISIDIANRASMFVDAAVGGEGVDYLCMS